MDRVVHCVEDVVVFFFFYWEVGVQDLLQGIFLGGFLERVVGWVFVDWFDEGGFLGKFLDLRMGFGDVGSVQSFIFFCRSLCQ